MRRRTKVLWFAAAATGLLVLFAPSEEGGRAPVSEIATDTRVPTGRAASGRSAPVPAELPVRGTLRDAAGDPFASRNWQPAPAASVSLPFPAPPPLPYRYAGALRVDGVLQILLAKGDKLVEAKAGDALEDGYRVESVADDSITLVYTPLKAKTTIQFTSLIATIGDTEETLQKDARIEVPSPVAGSASGAAAVAQPGDLRPAKLAWEGPKRVSVGNPFSVTLRMTSEQPVSALPMQLRFDPAVLESVGVRPGRLFASERGFSFRVNPEGSIFVGASSASAAPATDAELLVLSFRPIRPDTVAEVNVASLNLQGVAGRAIAHEQVAAFRTAIGR